MSFSALIEKMASGQTLDELEKQELVLRARALEQAEALFTSMVVPGTQNMSIQNLTATNLTIDNGDIILDDNSLRIDVGNGEIIIDGDGITLDNSVGRINFRDSNGDITMTIYGDVDDSMVFQQNKVNSEMVFSINLSVLAAANMVFREDPDQNNRAQLDIGVGPQGSKFTLGGTASINGSGASGGATYVQIEDSPVTPPTPAANGTLADAHIYHKGSKLIFQYEDSGTVRYKYLDLAGTGVTWVHTTSAP